MPLYGSRQGQADEKLLVSIIKPQCLACLSVDTRAYRRHTEGNSGKELSIPAQLQAMRQYATARNWQIVEEFAEPGASGRTANRRYCDSSSPDAGIIARLMDGKISYAAGSLEDPHVRMQALAVLEGGPEAFRRRQEQTCPSSRSDVSRPRSASHQGLFSLPWLMSSPTA